MNRPVIMDATRRAASEGTPPRVSVEESSIASSTATASLLIRFGNVASTGNTIGTPELLLIDLSGPVGVPAELQNPANQAAAGDGSKDQSQNQLLPISGSALVPATGVTTQGARESISKTIYQPSQSYLEINNILAPAGQGKKVSTRGMIWCLLLRQEGSFLNESPDARGLEFMRQRRIARIKANADKIINTYDSLAGNHGLFGPIAINLQDQENGKDRSFGIFFSRDKGRILDWMNPYLALNQLPDVLLHLAICLRLASLNPTFIIDKMTDGDAKLLIKVCERLLDDNNPRLLPELNGLKVTMDSFTIQHKLIRHYDPAYRYADVNHRVNTTVVTEQGPTESQDTPVGTDVSQPARAQDQHRSDPEHTFNDIRDLPATGLVEEVVALNARQAQCARDCLKAFENLQRDLQRDENLRVPSPRRHRASAQGDMSSELNSWDSNQTVSDDLEEDNRINNNSSTGSQPITIHNHGVMNLYF